MGPVHFNGRISNVHNVLGRHMLCEYQFVRLLCLSDGREADYKLLKKLQVQLVAKSVGLCMAISLLYIRRVFYCIEAHKQSTLVDQNFVSYALYGAPKRWPIEVPMGYHQILTIPKYGLRWHLGLTCCCWVLDLALAISSGANAKNPCATMPCCF